MFDTKAVECGWQRLGVVELEFRAKRGLELPAVWLEDRRSTITEKIPVFRIDYDRNAAASGVADYRRDKRRDEQSLVVILEHDGIGSIDGGQSSGQETLHVGTREIDAVLFVVPDELLRSRQHSGLRRSLSADADYRPCSGTDLVKHLSHQHAGGVLANGAYHVTRGSDRRYVLSDVGSTPQREFPLRDSDNGNGCFGRNPI